MPKKGSLHLDNWRGLHALGQLIERATFQDVGGTVSRRLTAFGGAPERLLLHVVPESGLALALEHGALHLFADHATLGGLLSSATRAVGRTEPLLLRSQGPAHRHAGPHALAALEIRAFWCAEEAIAVAASSS